MVMKDETPATTPTTGVNRPSAAATAEPAAPASREAARYAESLRIRSVLMRYEAACNRLDANAARSVWPGVDESALGREFDGLRSQKVSLGLCDITVIGERAAASCAGKARWEPKVGGGLQTADRHWNFSLRKTDDGWKIQEIQVR